MEWRTNGNGAKFGTEWDIGLHWWLLGLWSSDNSPLHKFPSLWYTSIVTLHFPPWIQRRTVTLRKAAARRWFLTCGLFWTVQHSQIKQSSTKRNTRNLSRCQHYMHATNAAADILVSRLEQQRELAPLLIRNLWDTCGIRYRKGSLSLA